MPDEVLTGLNLKPGDTVIDGTVGGGGHTLAILKKIAPDGRVLALDADPAALQATRARLQQAHIDEQRFTLVQSYNDQMQEVAHAHKIKNVAGILLDLGISSYQLIAPGRGFSFGHEPYAPLDMRMDPSVGEPAFILLARMHASDIERVLRDYGEEPNARAIARAIVNRRTQPQSLRTVSDLVSVIDSVQRGRRGRIHPATRSFQALRIAVNHELERLTHALAQSLALLKPGGRLAVISFHSLEDRIVKQFMTAKARNCICPPQAPLCVCGHSAELKLITKKPLTPSEKELTINPRARSAKLRIAARP